MVKTARNPADRVHRRIPCGAATLTARSAIGQQQPIGSAKSQPLPGFGRNVEHRFENRERSATVTGRSARVSVAPGTVSMRVTTPSKGARITSCSCCANSSSRRRCSTSRRSVAASAWAAVDFDAGAGLADLPFGRGAAAGGLERPRQHRLGFLVLNLGLAQVAARFRRGAGEADARRLDGVIEAQQHIALAHSGALGDRDLPNHAVIVRAGAHQSKPRPGPRTASSCASAGRAVSEMAAIRRKRRIMRGELYRETPLQRLASAAPDLFRERGGRASSQASTRAPWRQVAASSPPGVTRSSKTRSAGRILSLGIAAGRDMPAGGQCEGRGRQAVPRLPNRRAGGPPFRCGAGRPTQAQRNVWSHIGAEHRQRRRTVHWSRTRCTTADPLLISAPSGRASSRRTSRLQCLARSSCPRHHAASPRSRPRVRASSAAI